MTIDPPDTRSGLHLTTAGFTLVEVMVAVAVIAIALVALLGSQAQSLGRAGETAFNRIAPLLASAKLAEVEGRLLPIADGEGNFAPDRPEFRWQLRVGAPVPGGKEPLAALVANVWRVEVLVTREDTPYSYALVTYMGKNHGVPPAKERP